MKVTISDVASLAGVAKSTVSRYLNGGYVSEGTKRKIDHVIKKTNYMPNTFAQSLKAKNTNLIGLIIPRLNSYTASLVLKGIDEKLREKGYQMLISNAEQKKEREIESIYSFANQKVAGIILIATVLTSEHLKAIKEIGIPVITVGQEHNSVPSLTFQDEQAGYTLGTYVAERGHKKILYMGVKQEDIAVGVKRKQGFIKAIEERGYCDIDYIESSFFMKDARKLFSDLLEKGRCLDRTIVVCATDNIALGVMQATRQHGLKVPDDISVTGFGDYEIADLIDLTTVRYPHQESGELAAEKIILLSKGQIFKDIQTAICELIERGSVANLKSYKK